MTTEIKLTIHSGQPMADSREIAKHFCKRHDGVLQSIDNLLKSLTTENSADNFVEVSETGIGPDWEPRHFLLSRKAFALVAMRFTRA